MSSEYEALQAQTVEARGELVEALRGYERRGGKLPPEFGPDFTEEQRVFLAGRAQAESSRRDLLNEILGIDHYACSLSGRKPRRWPSGFQIVMWHRPAIGTIDSQWTICWRRGFRPRRLMRQ